MKSFCENAGRKKKARFFLLTGLLAAAMLWTAGCSVQTQERISVEEDGSAYVLPVILPLSGDISSLGEDAEWSVGYAVSQINETGGINGIPVSVRIYDTENSSSQAKSIARELAGSCRFFIGPIDSVGTAAIADVITETGTPNVAAYSYETLRTQAAPYGISYMSDSTEGEIEAVREWKALNPDIESVCILISRDENSQLETAGILRQYLPELSMSVKAVVSIDSTQNNGLHAVVEALNAKADGYIILARAADYGNIVSELRKRGITEGRRFTASFASYDNTLSSSHPDALADTYTWNKFDVDYPGAKWQALLAAYQKDHNGNKPDYNIVPDIYNAVFAWKQCMEELQLAPQMQDPAAEKAAIADWFYQSPPLNGIQGSYQWIAGNKKSPVYYFLFDQNGRPISVQSSD